MGGGSLLRRGEPPPPATGMRMSPPFDGCRLASPGPRGRTTGTTSTEFLVGTGHVCGRWATRLRALPRCVRLAPLKGRTPRAARTAHMLCRCRISRNRQQAAPRALSARTSGRTAFNKRLHRLRCAGHGRRHDDAADVSTCNQPSSPPARSYFARADPLIPGGTGTRFYATDTRLDLLRRSDHCEPDHSDDGAQ